MFVLKFWGLLLIATIIGGAGVLIYYIGKLEQEIKDETRPSGEE